MFRITASLAAAMCLLVSGFARADAGKPNLTVYYNGPVLVVWKTHGHKSDSVAKQRFSLSPEGDSLILEVLHIQPEGKPEKLVLAKQP